MSADLLELRLPIIKMPPSSLNSDKADADSDSCISEEDCHTPKSPDHRIPPVLCCPPAPRKPLRRRSCKRKLCDQFDFYRVVAEEELDSFFRKAEENIGGAAKRRCLLL